MTMSFFTNDKLQTENFGEQGFTLIETLLYVTIVGIVVGGFIVFIYSILIASDRAQANIELADAKLFITQKMEWVLSGAQSIMAPPASASGGTLTLTKVNFAENPITVDVSNGMLRIQTADGAYVPLTPREGVSVSNLLFEHAVSGLHERIRMTALLIGRYATTSIDQTIVIK